MGKISVTPRFLWSHSVLTLAQFLYIQSIITLAMTLQNSKENSKKSEEGERGKHPSIWGKIPRLYRNRDVLKADHYQKIKT